MAHSEHKVLAGSLVVVVLLIAAAFAGWRLLSANVVVTAHAGKIEATNNTSVSSSSTTSNRNAFAPRRIAVLAADAHPALDRALPTLRDELAALTYVEAVDVFAPGQRPEPGGRLYDVYLTLGFDVTKDDKTLGSRTFEATVTFFAGPMPYVSHSSYVDHLTSPSLRFQIQGKIDHRSTSTEVGTQYKVIADNLAKELTEQLAGKFDEWHAEHAIDFDWPDALMGEYPDDLDIPWPAGLELEPLVDGYGPMRHRHAMWTTRTDKPKAIVRAFHQACTDAGWRIKPGAVIEDDLKLIQRYHLRARNDYPVEIEVFEVRENSGLRKPGEVSRICVRYQHRFNRPEIFEAFDQLMDERRYEVARMLTRSVHQARSDRFYEAIASTNPTDPQTLLELAKFHHRHDRLEQAEQTLIAAHLNRHRAGDVSKMSEALKKAAEDMGFDELADPPITVASLKKFGYQTVDQLAGTTRTVGLNEPVLVIRELNGRTYAVDVYLAKAPNQPDALQLNMFERHDNRARSHSRIGTQRDKDGRAYANERLHDNLGTLKARFRQQADHPDRFDVELTLTPNADPPKPG